MEIGNTKAAVIRCDKVIRLETLSVMRRHYYYLHWPDDEVASDPETYSSQSQGGCHFSFKLNILLYCLMFLLMIQERSHLFYKWLYEATQDIRIILGSLIFPDTSDAGVTGG